MGNHGQVKAEKINENKEENGKEIVLKVLMHCEGCSSKVINCLKGFEGIEEVKTDMKGDRVTVKGQKADPLKVLERVKKKYSRNAQLISPQPKLKANDQKDLQKKQENPIEVISLKMYMHCEGCANDIKKSIERMKGILNVEPDRENSIVTIRGTFDPSNIVKTIRRRLGKYAEIVATGSNDRREGNGDKKGDEEVIVLHYPPQYSAQNTYPNHIFSDENIFSCSII